ncbi:hypothetical protein SBD_2161 [Streptomyces bottropensis ATCC 25435]|uniref:Uncharacterized protein n=1 Tax=Streptomyces bottropensis ATCC 25435 TaxID=1054862 RepID=M3FTW8_9ACTN|nr:hypothetical protein SBD_2161 [Streptomyces bottropensis ATCC 25435]
MWAARTRSPSSDSRGGFPGSTDPELPAPAWAGRRDPPVHSPRAPQHHPCGQPARTTTRKKEKPMEAKSQAAARTSTTQTPENLATEEVVIAVDVDDEE